MRLSPQLILQDRIPSLLSNISKALRALAEQDVPSALPLGEELSFFLLKVLFFSVWEKQKSFLLSLLEAMLRTRCAGTEVKKVVLAKVKLALHFKGGIALGTAAASVQTLPCAG